MRKYAMWVAAPIGAIVVAALTFGAYKAAQTGRAADDLESDLALVKAAEVEFASRARTQVVSAIEAGTIPEPAPRRTRGAGPKAPVKTEVAPVDEAPAVVLMPVSRSPEPIIAVEAPTVSDLPPLPRPRPIEPRFPTGDGSVWGSGSGGTGAGEGGMDRGRGTVVIRGGSGGHDPCIPRRAGDIPRIGSISISINERGPAGRTTFPSPRR